ncbi:MAG TPA: helix-turn-helix domain-containing protein [Limnochordia bacterium]|nr:helix-turn-helix domain-containing protein [Limnochordia bacterium]
MTKEKRRRFLTEREAAEFLGISPITLRQWRWRLYREGPPWYMVGRNVRYDLDELDRWLETRRADPVEIREG